MFFSAEVIPTDDTPLTLSLEFAWKAKSTYWAGKIRVIDLYIDDQLRYTINIPQRDDREAQAISLPFKKHGIGFSASEIHYLIIKKLETASKITLKAGIFNEKQGNSLTRNFDGSWRHDIRLTREDVSVSLDVSSFELGNHYKIIATHGMERTEPGSSFWQGENLHAVVEENGPSKKNAAVPPRALSTSFFHSSNPSETHHDKASPSVLEFTSRKEHSENPQEIAFFTLALEKKYEEAIMYASNMDDQGLGGRLILDLLKYREELGVDVNTMNDNSLKQSPLHRVAINKKWHAYYALVERGAASYLPDSNGIPAYEYRSRNGLTIFNQQAQQQIRRDLFGDAAPQAEAFINAANQNCCVS